MNVNNSVAPFNLQLANSNGNSDIFLTQNNVFTIQVTNTCGTDLSLQGGKPSDQPGTIFMVFFDFSSLFSIGTDQQHISLTLGQWTAKYFDGNFPGWYIASNGPYTWKDKESIIFTISDFTPTVSAGTFYVNTTIFNFNALPAQPNQLTVFVQNPTGDKLNLMNFLGISLECNNINNSNEIDITKTSSQSVENNIVITFLNKSQGNIVTAPWPENDPPYFIVSFIYSDPPGYYALTTANIAGSFVVGTMGGDTLWSVEPVTGAPNPQWRIEPTFANQELLGAPPTNFIAQFSFDGITTQCNMGPTAMYVQYLNVPGYDNGATAILLEKKYLPMAINSFAINKANFQVAEPENMECEAFLSWSVSNATNVELSGYGPVDFANPSFPVYIDRSKTFVLQAYDSILCTIVSQKIPVTVTPSMSSRLSPIGSIMMWKGAVNTIPNGWILCDGKNSTPNLADLFIIGAGGNQPVNATDANPQHLHVLSGLQASPSPNTENAGSHTHSFPSNWYGRNLTCGGKTSIDTGGGYTANMTTQSAGEHNHCLPVNLNTITANNTTLTRPAWYALCFIMKTSAG